jgi:hypothetical protein
MKSDLALQQLHEAGFANARKLTGDNLSMV